MIVTGLNKVRDFHSAKITHAEFGTGTTSETQEDTDLETPITSTEVAIDSTVATSQMFVKTATLTSADGINNDVTEMIWKVDSPELALSRITHPLINHTSSDDIIYETRWFQRGALE